MNTHAIKIAPALLGVTLVLGTAQAQDHAHHAVPQPEPAAHDHSGHGKPPAETSGTDRTGMEHARKSDDTSHDSHDVPPAAGQESAVDHSGMDHSRMDHSGMHPPGTNHDRPPPTGLPLPEPTDADRAAAFPDVHPHTTHDRRVVSLVRFNRLEAWDDEGGGQAWEATAWIGNDHHKLWLRSEGEREGGHTESADLEVLYGRPIAPWWDLVAGVRHDFQPGAPQTFAAIGVMGLAPYMFEVSATAYLGESGQTAASIEAEYEMLLTNRLILQPLIEATVYGKDDARRGIGSGLATVEAGLRLRYEFTRRFAPYVGVAWERAYGTTADFRREEGEGIDDTRIVMGVRFWF